MKSKVGWTADRVLLAENGVSRAAAQILRRPLPGTPFCVLYVPKGPGLDYYDVDLLNSVLEWLEGYARRNRAIFIKIDPDLALRSPGADCLPQRGWRLSGEQIQYRNTVVLALGLDEEEMLSRMKPKWRYNIRVAERRGVRIESGGEAEMPMLYGLYAETGARDGFLIRQFSYYQELWGRMIRAGLAKMFLARLDGEIIAGLILFTFSDRAWYFYGSSSSAHRDSMPNHLLQWEAIRWAKGHGFRQYDFWGAPDHLDERDPMFGVYKFKMGFGGQFVERIPAHDYVINPLLYWLYAIVRPRYLSRLRKQSPK